jgi:hypothetical protein
VITAIEAAATASFAMVGSVIFSAFFQQNAKIRDSWPVAQVADAAYM